MLIYVMQDYLTKNLVFSRKMFPSKFYQKKNIVFLFDAFKLCILNEVQPFFTHRK